jgi:hypothetical protein
MTEDVLALAESFKGLVKDFAELGARRERERIIALLDAEHSEFTEQHQTDPIYLGDDCSACFSIAVIRGEQS